MKMKSKLIATIVSMCAAIAVMAVGVWAASTSFDVTISNTINIETNRVDADIYTWTTGASTNVTGTYDGNTKAELYNSASAGTTGYTAEGLNEATLDALSNQEFGTGYNATNTGLSSFSVAADQMISGSQIIIAFKYVAKSDKTHSDIEVTVKDTSDNITTNPEAAVNQYFDAAYYCSVGITEPANPTVGTTVFDRANVASQEPGHLGVSLGIDLANGDAPEEGQTEPEDQLLAQRNNGTFYIYAVLTYTNPNYNSVNEGMIWTFTLSFQAVSATTYTSSTPVVI